MKKNFFNDKMINIRFAQIFTCKGNSSWKTLKNCTVITPFFYGCNISTSIPHSISILTPRAFLYGCNSKFIEDHLSPSTFSECDTFLALNCKITDDIIKRFGQRTVFYLDLADRGKFNGNFPNVRFVDLRGYMGC